MEFIADTHVHLYPCYDTAAALRFAMLRLAMLAPGLPRVLCLTERSDCHFFRDLHSGAKKIPPPFSFHTSGDSALTLTDNAGQKIYLIAGRQIATLEKLEVHCLGIDADIPDRLPIADVIESVIVAGGIPVIPWGLGKWLGKRGHIVRDIAAKNSEVFLGDSTMRPTIWPEPVFSSARSRVLAGSDPLPFAGDEVQIGVYSTVFTADFDENDPAESLRAALRNATNSRRIVGERCSAMAVYRRQMAMKKAAR
jgi:hypothetical protein